MMSRPSTGFFVAHPTFFRGIAGHHIVHRYYAILGGLFDKPDLASTCVILAALENPKTVLVDVRSPDEIQSAGKIQYKRLAWINASGSPFDCPPLANGGAEKILPGNKEAPIIVYCASGKRAQKAKAILEEQGYAQVLNAGGMEDFAKLLS